MCNIKNKLAVNCNSVIPGPQLMRDPYNYDLAVGEMTGQQQQKEKISFKIVSLFKDQTLGIGSYGAVCKAKCDDLLCADSLSGKLPTADPLPHPSQHLS